jgi:hypothetical protein
MSSPAKVAANRRNATKSTGPKTLAGKKASAMNATRHALLSVAPVLPIVERAEEWVAHRSATIASLAPVGYVENVLADRVASLLWRLGRVTRYETENTASELEIVEEDLSEELEEKQRHSFLRSLDSVQGRPVLGTTLEAIREELVIRKEKVKGFLYLRELGAEDPFPPEHAEHVLLEVAKKAEVELEDVSIPFLPPEADELGWSKWTGWTKELVVRVIDAILATTKRTNLRAHGAEEAWRACGVLAELDVRRAATTLRDLEATLQRSVRSRVLLSAEGLEKVARYETHLERSLYKALHELQRLQATRTGTGGAPLALDVDVSVGPRRTKPEALDMKASYWNEPST